MNFENQYYEDVSKRIMINLHQNDKETSGVWLDKGQIIIKFTFDHIEKKFNSLDGVIGSVIKNSNLDLEEKVNRCFEVIENGLWECKINNLSSINSKKN